MAVTYQKFNVFTKDLVNGVHNFSSHSFKLLLSNTAPVATNAVKGDLTEITAANGYAAGGVAMPVTVSTSSGTAKVTGTSETITASSGSFGPYRYVSLYNDSVASPLKPLVGFWDYGSAISTNDTETFTFTPDATNGVFTLV
jgi:hypothetical protein